MAYDEHLARRVRAALRDRRGVTEKKMFGGLAFLADGRMFCGRAAASASREPGPLALISEVRR